ncbi:MAG: CHAT domain-containing protein, partial [Planctomycetota bacterium JB042]
RAFARAAGVLESLGRYEEARAAYRRAVDQATSVESAAYRASIQAQAGGFLLRRARYEEAEPLLRAAAESPEWRVRSNAAASLGRVLVQLGRPHEALRIVRRLEREAAERSDDQVDLQVREWTANVLSRVGAFDEAADRYRTILERLPGDARAERAGVRMNLGLVDEALERPEEARDAYARALAVFEARGDREDEAAARVNLGRVLCALGDAESALVQSERVVALGRELETPRLVASGLEGKAEASLALGRIDDAERLSREARAIFRESDAIEDELETLRTQVGVALAREDDGAAAAIVAEAEAILERDDVRLLSAEEAAGLRSRFAVWSELTQDTIACAVACADGDRAAAVVRDGLARAARWKGRSLLEGLVGRRLEPDEVAGPDHAARVQAALPREFALVEYVAGRSRLFAYVVSSDEVALVDLGARTIEEDARSYLAALSQVGRPAAEIVDAGAALHRRLIEPVLARLGRPPEGLVVVPSAALSVFPFEALVAEPGRSFLDTTFLIDRVRVVYAPSTSVFLRMQTAPPRAETSSRSLVFAAPTTSVDRGWDRLHGADVEMARLCDRLRDGFEPPEGGDRTLRELRLGRADEVTWPELVVRTRAAATEEALAEVAGAYRLVHFAVHGHVDLADPRRSGLVLTQTDRSDGVLTLGEIEGLGLRADLVVLSACATAVGRVRRGEGVQSILDAFVRGGAGAVVGTLFMIDDVRAPDLMARFYDHLLVEGRPVEEALRLARIAVRRGAARGSPLVDPARDVSGHPAWWAPFVYVGPVGR